jgi:MoaD family protein
MPTSKELGSGDEGPTVGLTIHVYDVLRRLTGLRQIEVQMEVGSTLEELFRHLGSYFDQRFMDICQPREGEQSISVVLLNGRALHFPDALQTELADGDELHLIPPIAGG